MRAETVGRRAGRFLQRLCCRRMIAVRVSYKNMRDPLALEARQQRLDVLGEIGAGIDDRDLALADDIGAGALVSEGPGIARHDPPHSRRHRFEPAVFEGDVSAIGYVDRHAGWPQDGATTSVAIPGWLVEESSRAEASDEDQCRTERTPE